MKNILKIVSFSIFTIVLTVNSSFAQEEVQQSKSEKKCSSGCCSTKEAGTEMKMEGMDHKTMSDCMSIDENKDGKIFECPMKCEAGKDTPGECSKCGMKLKEVSIKEAGHKMGMKDQKMMDQSKIEHSKITHSEMSHNSDGEIEKLNFAALDVNKDGKVFQCPMVCTSDISDKAGDCTVCGMHMKEVSIKEAEKNVLEHDLK